MDFARCGFQALSEGILGARGKGGIPLQKEVTRALLKMDGN
jgi:hypothetical protein